MEVGNRVRYTGDIQKDVFHKVGTIISTTTDQCRVKFDGFDYRGCSYDNHNCYRSNLTVVPAKAAVKDTNPKDAIGDTKVPYFLLSAVAKAEWALAQFAGMLKYGSWNWRSAGVRASVYLSAMERHLEAYKSGEELDPVDGSHHLGNIMACAAILLDAKAAGKLNDDRPPSVDLRPTFARVEAQMAVLKAQYKDKTPYHHTIKDTNAST